MTTTRAEPQPADFADVRTTNLAVVLRHLRTHGPSSRAAIAASTGLTKATVSSLTGDLIGHRLLRETGLSGNRIGRPATVLALDGSAYASIGIQVGPDRLTALAVDYSGDQLLLWHRAVDRAARNASAITALAQRAAGRVRQQGRHVLGLTVAVPGLVEENGTVRLSPALGWSGLDLRAQVAGSLRSGDLAVSVANHAALAAVAEHRHGGHPEATLAYVSGAAGLEAGLIVDGRPLRGGRGYTGQLGRFTLGPAGTPSLQDNAGIEPLVRRALPDFDPEALADLGPAVEQVAVRARAGDPGVLAALRHTGSYLGQGMALLVNLLSPEVIVLGDHFATLAEWLIPAAEAELNRHTSIRGTRITASGLGLHAAALGGAVSHLDQVDTGRIPRPLG
ncbi:ROK family protein [Actinoplanes teichomyceticus]|uniref:Putative NBD/HSP70 family sugar kinase n=1 Tax=Actinoplanes teichomyceticus TaxID=1867 RepID=A0A561VGC1_ACTTI|nr:ROK family protein [Actinoplanes teichomyceticus]TWG10648.1 putative NBD/HSP70 family sugar kinase [Actinoplanes teichomyceticus]GIF15417.1 xylose repressor [Actinoplanes teichomyceticus]